MIFNRYPLLKALALSFLLFSAQAGDLYAGPAKPSTTKTGKQKSLRLFIIGNSFSQNAARFLPQLAQEEGHELVIGRAEIGGASMQRHWDSVEAYEANPEDPKGKPYKGKSLKMLLSEGTWDVVTIQQNSMNSGYLDSYQPYADKLYQYIKQLQPKAEIILHQTWAYRSDAKTFTLVNKTDHAPNQKAMWENSRAAYHSTAKKMGLRLFPVGDAFWRVSSDSKWGYQPDKNFNFTHPVSPALPVQENSLHKGYFWSKDKLSLDANHANASGEYLGSLIWFGVLFEESPRVIDYLPETVPAGFGKYLKKVAVKEVKKSRKY
ncbi:MAG: DUF4886 domain-containing protein [Adhaeribacter sp.]